MKQRSRSLPDPLRAVRLLSLLGRATAATVAGVRLAKVVTAAPPVRPTMTPSSSISVVIPARNEANRISPVLEAVVGAPGVMEVLVVDDESSDRTAEIASAAGAVVVASGALPDGWTGKAWALQRGIDCASGEWIVTLDADTVPDPTLPTAVVARAVGDRLDFVTLAGRFDFPTRGSRWLHAAMLTTLVYRFGPPGVRVAPSRTMANGQCMAFKRFWILSTGGMEQIKGDVVEDVALARRLAVDGAAVGFLDATDELTVRMFDSLADTWTGWGRSLALPGVEPQGRQLLDLAVIMLAQVLPLPRLILRRGDVVDLALLVMRVGTLVGTRRAYTRIDLAYWTSPVADLLAAVAIARGIQRRGRQVWRGRTYG